MRILSQGRERTIFQCSPVIDDMSLSTLYLCYFGLREPLVQTQVLPYLRQLAAGGIKVHLLTFEPKLKALWSEEAIRKQSEELARQGIQWYRRPYHKSPSGPATLYDILVGGLFVARVARREKIEILHARAHVPMAMALWARRFVNVKLVFDIRGLMAEEYADSGIWAERSLPFRLVKRLERAGIRHAHQIVVLTNRLRDWLVERNLKPAEQIEVIPCCVDFERFSQTVEEETAAVAQTCESNFEVVYAGSLMGLYLVEEMGRFFRAVKSQRPNAFLRILSLSPPHEGREALKRAGLDESDFEIQAVSPEGVPEYLRRARLGISLRKAAFAQIAASPTKVPEYLAVGLPVICNAGTGDVDKLLEGERVGVILRSFDDEACQAAAAQAIILAEDEAVRAHCRSVARAYFDLQSVGGARYLSLYRRLDGSAPLPAEGLKAAL
ncbi:MAG TPA: glycosyltransferase [Pyrinomonadaceae bacterium]|nr:glycosyltransferase [Pyrinomonadaceae bacterium]